MNKVDKLREKIISIQKEIEQFQKDCTHSFEALPLELIESPQGVFLLPGTDKAHRSDTSFLARCTDCNLESNLSHRDECCRCNGRMNSKASASVRLKDFEPQPEGDILKRLDALCDLYSSDSVLEARIYTCADCEFRILLVISVPNPFMSACW